MTGYTKKANYLAVDGTTVHVTGTYANGMPKIQIKLGGLGDENVIVSPTHRGRAGEPFTSTVYLRLVRVLQEAGVKWDASEDSTLGRSHGRLSMVRGGPHRPAGPYGPAAERHMKQRVKDDQPDGHPRH